MNFKVTEIGELPLEWDVDTMENALDEIIDYRGKTPAKSEAGIETLSAKSVKNGYIDYSKAYFISEMTYQKFMVRGFPRKGDILLTTEAPLGLVAKLDREKVGIAQRLLTLRGKKDYLLNDYLLYYLMSNEGQHQLTSRQSGTTVTGIKQKEFRKCLISIPPFEEQKAIAHILSTLDDKIEVNNQINKTLENMAQAIFKQWFVDFEFPNEDGEPYKSSGGEMVESELGMIPKGWEVVLLEEVAEFQNGYAFKSKELLDEDQGDCFHVFKMGHIKKGGGLNKEGTKSYVPKTDYGNLSRYIVKKGDLLMCMTDMKSNVALLGHTALMDEDNKYILNQRVGLIRTLDKEKMNYPYLFILTNSKGFIENLRSRANSGVQVNLSTKEIKESLLVMPQKEILEKFNCITENIFEEYFNLGKENSFLTSLRDSLLPKLMSGKIRVPLDSEGDVS